MAKRYRNKHTHVLFQISII